MEVTIWEVIDNYKKNGVKPEKNTTHDYNVYHKKLSAKMFGPEVQDEDLFSRYVGSDDGHYDLIDFILWHGQETTELFLKDPKTAIPLAKVMSKNPNFDGDINILQRIIH